MDQFRYYPHRVEEAVRAALQTHRKISAPSIAEAEPWLDSFLLRLAAASPSDYPDIAATLRLGELRLLASMLGRLHGHPVLLKLTELLSIRPERDVCRELWGAIGAVLR